LVVESKLPLLEFIVYLLGDYHMKEDLYFIVGSPRSGTKIFRDTLQVFPNIWATNHPLEDVWIEGLQQPPHDAYSPDSITPEIRESIRTQFDSLGDDSPILIEKNVRNSLRIPYIREIFPDAHFIHIIRHPLDVVMSLRKRWQNPIDWNYYLSGKVFELTPREILEYSWDLGWKFLERLLRGQKRVDIWGPHYPGIRDDLESKSLLEVCALQWKKCVTRARENGREGDADNYFELHYETLMTSPGEILPDIADFLNLDSPEPGLKFARNNFRTDSIGRGNQSLTPDEVDRVANTLGTTPETFGYSLTEPGPFSTSS
jgi:hypothetical protein